MNSNTTSNLELINKLQVYALDEKVIEKSLQMKIESSRKTFVPKEPFKIVNPINKIYIPIEKDTLFWCFYIMKHGDLQYEMLDNKNIVVEKRNKIEYIDDPSNIIESHNSKFKNTRDKYINTNENLNHNLLY